MKNVLQILKLVLAAIGKFLKFAYASQITIGLLAIIIYLSLSKLLGVIFLVWGLLLLLNEIKIEKGETKG